MNLIEKLNLLMKKNSIKNISQLSKLTSIPYTTLKSIFDGDVNDVRLSTSRKLCDHFKITLDELLDDDIPLEGFQNMNTDDKQKFPILGLVKAGYDYLAQENWIGCVSIDKKLADPENYFALKVTGSSMEPVLYEDDIVIVHKQNDVENGQFGIVIINNEEATVKKIIKHQDSLELIALNQYYPSKTLTKDDNLKIIGRVIEAKISKIFE